MVNVNLVCQSVPKEPLQARVSKGAVATAITACGFVTRRHPGRKRKVEVATAITACGIKKRHNDFYGRYVSFFVRRSFEKLLALYCAILCIYKAYKNIKSGKKISIIVDIQKSMQIL